MNFLLSANVDFTQLLTNIGNWLVTEGLKIVLALVVFAIYCAIIKAICKNIDKKLQKKNVDLTFRKVSVPWLKRILILLGFVCVLTYPAFLIGVAACVIGIIMTFAVPTFTSMFESMDIDLPWTTVALIALSHFFQRYSLVLLGVIALALLALQAFRMTDRGGIVLARAQLKIPIIGAIVRMSGASQFAHTMSTLLTAGMPILQAIEVSGRTMTNLCMARDIAATLPGVEGGRGLGECMSYSKELPAMLVQMTAVGEATGSMESTLKVLAEYYDNEVDVRTKRALSLLEPTIIIVLAIFVVFILMAVYLPMFSMYAAI